MENTDNLQQMLLAEAISGRSFYEMEQKHGIPALECATLIKNALASAPAFTTIEQRQLLSLRLEAVVGYMWAGLQNGSFKHGEAMLKAIHEAAELNALVAKQTVEHVTYFQDQQMIQIIRMLEYNNAELRRKIDSLELTAEIRQELEAWPEWVAESATNAVEAVVYAEVVEED